MQLLRIMDTVSHFSKKPEMLPYEFQTIRQQDGKIRIIKIAIIIWIRKSLFIVERDTAAKESVRDNNLRF